MTGCEMLWAERYTPFGAIVFKCNDYCERVTYENNIRLETTISKFLQIGDAIFE